MKDSQAASVSSLELVTEAIKMASAFVAALGIAVVPFAIIFCIVAYVAFPRGGGLNLFVVGMRNNRPDQLKEGLRLIRKHLGR